jgi:phosphoserine phosphatase RsbU/P
MTTGQWPAPAPAPEAQSLPLMLRSELVGQVLAHGAPPVFLRGVQRALEVMLRNGGQAGASRERDLYHEQAGIAQRLDEELQVARRIQLSLLPACPLAPGYTFDAKYIAAREVSGDFYDFLYHALAEGRLELVIGDVTGKGVPAALMMAHSRAVLRAEARHAGGPAELLMRTNQILTEDRLTRLFLSALYARVELAAGLVTYSNAGHDRPLLIRQETSRVLELDAPGVILGAFRGIELTDCVVQLGLGDTLVFYTDGVTEARNQEGELFGDERLAQAALAGADGDASNVTRSILDAVTTFTNGGPQADDLTLVVIQRRPA